MKFIIFFLCGVFAVQYSSHAQQLPDNWIQSDIETGNITNACSAMLFIEIQESPGIIPLQEGTRISPNSGYRVIITKIGDGELDVYRKRYLTWLKGVKDKRSLLQLSGNYFLQQRGKLISMHCSIQGALGSSEADAVHAAEEYISENGGPGRLEAELTRESVRRSMPINLQWLEALDNDERKRLDEGFRPFLAKRAEYFSPDAIIVIRTKDRDKEASD